MDQLPNSQRDAIFTLLRCPDCSNKLTRVDARRYVCTRRERQYSIDNGVIVLLLR